MAFDEKYMRLAIELAQKGRGAVNPNPLVGAVIVKNDRIIGQGYHARYGDLHAERAAFASLKESAEGAEMYVTLEPCCHYGKQPPCVEAIVENKIAKVYVGSDDPNMQVAGKGIKYLLDHGVKVETQVLKDECDDLNNVFFHYITNQTPYVVMKYAMTLDGKIATYKGESKWITGECARNNVQETRNELMGIMVGIGTVLKDDPMLTCRLPGGRNPIRIICDTKLQIPLESNIVKSAKNIVTIVATSELINNEKKIGQLNDRGIEVLRVNEENGHISLIHLMKELGKRKIDGILLEGGGTINYSAVSAGIVNEIHAYIAPKIFGGKDALTAVEGRGIETPDMAQLYMLRSITKIEDDILLKYIRNNERK